MDVEKTMEFILTQLASVATKQDRFADEMAAHRAAVAAEMAEHRAHVATELTEHRAQVTKETNDFLGMLKIWVNRFEERAHERSLKVDSLEDNLNALIKVVDGLVRRDNGHTTQ